MIEESKKAKLEMLNLEKILSDVKQGWEPDFGFINELKFDDDDRKGWNLFCGVISPYPKY